jgi:predicted O-methyltransferase YrrM
MLTKIISGKNRPTRFHDEKENFVGWNRLITHAPLAFSTGLLRLAIDYRPEIPWIAYDSIAILKAFLTRDSRVLEFGSGMSTIWYAKHAGEVYSVEDYQPWYNRVSDILVERGLSNVKYYFIEDSVDYREFMSHDQNGFDLIMVDGSNRSACIANSARLLRPGGILYLDNSDKHSSSQGSDTRIAEKYALEFARQKKAEVCYITDFAPTQFFVQQGLMIRTPYA